MSTYSTKQIPIGKKFACDDCGANADVLLVADTLDSSGYMDQVALCRRCAKDRIVIEAVHPFEWRSSWHT